MIKPIFCYKISGVVGLLPNNEPSYIQFEIDGLSIISKQVYKESHIRLLPMLVEKLNIDESFIVAISFEEYEVAPVSSFLKKVSKNL